MHPTTDPDPRNHHLWRNGRYWWIAITVYDAEGRKRRERHSLRTPDVALARARRDAILAQVARSTHWRLAKPASPSPCPQGEPRRTPFPSSSTAAAGVAA